MTRRRARYRPNRKGVAGWLAHDVKLQAAMTGIASEGKVFAEAIAPRRTGEYASHFGVEEGGATARDRRASATLFNDADHAAAVEFDQHHTLGRTADFLNGGG